MCQKVGVHVPKMDFVASNLEAQVTTEDVERFLNAVEEQTTQPVGAGLQEIVVEKTLVTTQLLTENQSGSEVPPNINDATKVGLQGP